MEYYQLQKLTNSDGTEPSEEQLQKFKGAYCANFRPYNESSVCWRLITPYMQMKHGNPITSVDVELCVMKGIITKEEDSVTVANEKYSYRFEKIEVNPLDAIVKG